VFKAA